MSRLYGSIEPSVVDEDMLQKAVEEQGPKEEAGRIAKAEGIDFKDVLQLRLDFRNILKIDNLWQFVNLTMLQLDNNIIEKIEGLEMLVNLVWLDLSFNNIEAIEGLDSLVKLEDLSLYNNRIPQIENMDALEKLQVLSLGNNILTSLENLIGLRNFKQLRTLNLAGNPISDHDDYKLFIAAYLPNLVYLDFRLLDENTKEIAAVKYQDDIDDLKRSENLILTKLKEESEKNKELEYHKAAFVEYLNSSFLFESMYAEDVESEKLSLIPGVAGLLETYPSQEHQQKTQLYSEIQHISDTEIIAVKIEQIGTEISHLKETLMTLEIQLVDQLEEIIKDFERNTSDMASTFIETVQGYMAQIRDFENHHNEKLLEIAISTLEKIGKGIFDEDIPDDVRMLFIDKDTIVNAVAASHDIHLLKIDNLEDDLITKINSLG
ncbi:dynein regulatory complex subunit 3 isoform X3 [Rhinatrema bivittatum]|uniref:dynein regulatory complex subunit 3 isoform X3 n=1 Tax=Rhinatrema bivittatum TaxID=194408 RepID=UPI0011276A67|nr:dynein regulatory complex subunit 3 isoform X3 [Rhinatrema bivittatum]